MYTDSSHSRPTNAAVSAAPSGAVALPLTPRAAAQGSHRGIVQVGTHEHLLAGVGVQVANEGPDLARARGLQQFDKSSK